VPDSPIETPPPVIIPYKRLISLLPNLSVIGILIGLVVLITRFKPVTMTIVAGVLMILSLVGAFLGYGLAAVVGGLAGLR